MLSEPPRQVSFTFGRIGPEMETNQRTATAAGYSDEHALALLAGSTCPIVTHPGRQAAGLQTPPRCRPGIRHSEDP